jgi:cytochrome P450
VHRDMMGLTLDIVLQTLFGDAEVPDFEQVDAIVGAMMLEYQRRYMSWRSLLPRPFVAANERRMDEVRGALDEVLYGIITQRRRAGSQGDDLLGRLLAARDDQGVRMTDVQLRDEVATMFLAGHETTALALSYALWLLARHPGVQAKLHEELARVLGGRRPTLCDVASLTYTDAVVREAMRLYPPVYAIGRETLREVEIGGYVIPRGAQLFIPQWAVHRDPRWFESPEQFLPERWLDGLGDRLPRLAYMPFGGGPRVCVGNHFAMLEAVLALAVLVQRFGVAEAPGFTLKMMPTVTLRPRHGVRVHIEPRAKPA